MSRRAAIGSEQVPGAGVARTCSVGPRLVPGWLRKAADLQRVATVSDFLTVGSTLGAEPLISLGHGDGASSVSLKAGGRGANLRACPSPTPHRLHLLRQREPFCFGRGRGRVPCPDGLRALALGVARIIRAHGQKFTDRGYALFEECKPR